LTHQPRKNSKDFELDLAREPLRGQGKMGRRRLWGGEK